jgi:hypothetical protein
MWKTCVSISLWIRERYKSRHAVILSACKRANDSPPHQGTAVFTAQCPRLLVNLRRTFWWRIFGGVPGRGHRGLPSSCSRAPSNRDSYTFLSGFLSLPLAVRPTDWWRIHRTIALAMRSCVVTRSGSSDAVYCMGRPRILGQS